MCLRSSSPDAGKWCLDFIKQSLGMLLLLPHFRLSWKWFLQTSGKTLCTALSMKEWPFEDKADLFSPLCSKYQWEYACNNIQRITLSASRCNKMHTWFWLSFSVVFSRRVLKWQCIFYMRMNSHSHMLQMFFRILSLCDVDHIHVGWCAVVKGFQCFDGPF